MNMDVLMAVSKFKCQQIFSNLGLNLSRALGDHCYKQKSDISLKDQMITALPDVELTTLTDKDSFLVLACDGIW